jgi:hypothetical protein
MNQPLQFTAGVAVADCAILQLPHSESSASLLKHQLLPLQCPLSAISLSVATRILPKQAFFELPTETNLILCEIPFQSSTNLSTITNQLSTLAWWQFFFVIVRRLSSGSAHNLLVATNHN